MLIETVGMDQLALQLIFIYERSHGGRAPGPLDLWRAIFELMLIDPEAEKFFSLYKIGEYSDRHPSSQFLGDLHEVLKGGFAILREGKCSSTSTGSCLAGARQLPERVKSLQFLLEQSP
jgi:hypothetical protein